MATDVKNLAGGDTGNSERRGGIVVKSNRNQTQKQLPPLEVPDYAISDFDAAQANLSTRFDDPRYYQGDTTA